jgi:hypothetical protein
MASITCGNCKATTDTAASVRACYKGDVAPCGWLVAVPGRWVDYDEWGPEYIEDGEAECGAHTTITDRGWSCEAGHSYVSMQARHDEGWDYAEDDGEANNLFRAGTEPRDFLTGGPYRLGA